MEISFDLLLKFPSPTPLSPCYAFEIGVKQRISFPGAAARDSLPTDSGSKAVLYVPHTLPPQERSPRKAVYLVSRIAVLPPQIEC